MADEWEGQWVENPPPRNDNTRRRWPNRLAPLADNPGAWARFGPFSESGIRNIATRIRGGSYGDGFDAYCNREDGFHFIYVSFTGGPRA